MIDEIIDAFRTENKKNLIHKQVIGSIRSQTLLGFRVAREFYETYERRQNKPYSTGTITVNIIHKLCLWIEKDHRRLEDS